MLYNLSSNITTLAGVCQWKSLDPAEGANLPLILASVVGFAWTVIRSQRYFTVHAASTRSDYYLVIMVINISIALYLLTGGHGWLYVFYFSISWVLMMIIIRVGQIEPPRYEHPCSYHCRYHWDSIRSIVQHILFIALVAEFPSVSPFIWFAIPLYGTLIPLWGTTKYLSGRIIKDLNIRRSFDKIIASIGLLTIFSLFFHWSLCFADSSIAAGFLYGLQLVGCMFGPYIISDIDSRLIMLIRYFDDERAKDEEEEEEEEEEAAAAAAEEEEEPKNNKQSRYNNSLSGNEDEGVHAPGGP